MKLQQGQVWKQGGEYLRLVRVSRTEVEYKSMMSPTTKDGTHLRATKKEFCRLVKNATLMQVANNQIAAISHQPALQKPKEPVAEAPGEGTGPAAASDQPPGLPNSRLADSNPRS
jgi:hypothetical protein